MESGLSIKILYWSEQIGDNQILDFLGIEDFKKDLSNNYISVVQGRPGDLGGGLYEMTIEFISNIRLSDLVEILLEGATYDLIKSGSQSFILRPFIKAYHKLKEKNKNSRLDIAELNIFFKDTTVKIYKIGKEDIINQLEKIIHFLSSEYNNLTLISKERPFEIHIPVFEDNSTNRIIRYRCLLDVDETIINIKDTDYYKYWGIVYDFARKNIVYDVKHKKLLEDEFYTQNRYWYEWENNRKMNS